MKKLIAICLLLLLSTPVFAGEIYLWMGASEDDYPSTLPIGKVNAALSTRVGPDRNNFVMTALPSAAEDLQCRVWHVQLPQDYVAGNPIQARIFYLVPSTGAVCWRANIACRVPTEDFGNTAQKINEEITASGAGVSTTPVASPNLTIPPAWSMPGAVHCNPNDSATVRLCREVSVLNCNGTNVNTAEALLMSMEY